VRIELQKSSREPTKTAKSQQAPAFRVTLEAAKVNPDVPRVKHPDQLVAVERKGKLRPIMSV
jgi:hypothetical protein